VASSQFWITSADGRDWVRQAGRNHGMCAVEQDHFYSSSGSDALTSISEIEVRHPAFLDLDPPTKAAKTVTLVLADRLIESGIQDLDDHEVLELLFSFVSSDGDSKEWAGRCIERFRNLRCVIEASIDELLHEGLSWSTAVLVRLAAEIPMKVLAQRLERGPVYQSSQEVYDYLNYSMRGLGDEVFRTIYLDGANRIIETVDVTGGTPNSVAVFPRKVLEHAIKYQATSMFLAHNHPAGNPLPSRKDKMLTRDLVFLGKALQVEVLDHIIVGDNNHFSFFDEGLITEYEDSFLTMRRRAVT